jgi:hypothetical protein
MPQKQKLVHRGADPAMPRRLCLGALPGGRCQGGVARGALPGGRCQWGVARGALPGVDARDRDRGPCRRVLKSKILNTGKPGEEYRAGLGEGRNSV